MPRSRQRRMVEEQTDSGLVVVQAAKADDWVAGQIAMAIKANSEEHGVTELAEKIGVPQQQVINVLDSFDGSFSPPRLVGPGCGGGWLPGSEKE
jgi:hypothetical protein